MHADRRNAERRLERGIAVDRQTSPTVAATVVTRGRVASRTIPAENAHIHRKPMFNPGTFGRIFPFMHQKRSGMQLGRKYLRGRMAVV